MQTEFKVLERLIGTAAALELLNKAKQRGLEGWALERVFAALIERLAGSVPGTDRASRMARYKVEPVGIRQFIESPFYLGKAGSVYPEILKDLEELNSGRYDEAVLTGGIGSGKTTIALYSQAYQLYLLSCLRNPHQMFELDSSSEIKVIFQNLKYALAKGVDYDRFRSMIEGSKYFQRHFMFNPDLSSKLVFPNRIEVEPVSGSETASIGQNVIGGIIDEINFMQVVEASKQAADGGVYNQATELYNTIARRRKSRFMRYGAMPGLLCLVSSKKTPGQFTDVKEAEAKDNPRIYVYDKRVWDIKPWAYSGETFRVFIGNETRKPRLLHKDEKVPEKDEPLVDNIPVEFEPEFKDDITKALRDIAGKSTMAIHPFMSDTERVVQNFGKRASVVKEQRVDFKETLASVMPGRILNKQHKRFAHLDLALSADSAGVVIGHCEGFTRIRRDENFELLPVIAIDCALEVFAPQNGEIEFSKIRQLLYTLRDLGMPITWVTLDTYQSVDTVQILRGQSFITGYQSMDTTIVPYQILKAALYDGRVPMPEHQLLRHELLTLERDFKKNKIDHNAHGSKDIADALAGVVYGLTNRLEVWLSHGVNPVSSPSVYSMVRPAATAE